MTENKYLYSVTTGLVEPGTKEADSVYDFAKSHGGLSHVHVTKDGIIWLYDTLNNAKIGRNIMEAAGIICGRNICRFEVKDDGLLYVGVEV